MITGPGRADKVRDPRQRGMNDHMMLVRMLARPMLSAIFVIQGVRAIRNPDALVPRAKPVADQIVPTLKRLAPAKVADRIPENPRTLVRLNGLVQLAGGLALATGQGRRAGAVALAASLVPTTLAGHPFWEEDDPVQRSAQQLHFLKNLSMFGGLLLAAVDTEGKPGLMWRARHGAKDAKRASKRMSRTARREAHHATVTARREAEHASAQARREAKHAVHVAQRQARSAAKTARRGSKHGMADAAKSASKVTAPVRAKVHATH